MARGMKQQTHHRQGDLFEEVRESISTLSATRRERLLNLIAALLLETETEVPATQEHGDDQDHV